MSVELEQISLQKQFEEVIASEDKLRIQEFLNDQNISDVADILYDNEDYEGQIIAHLLLKEGKPPKRFTTKTALGYPSGKYGSQKYHRVESGLDPISICKHLEI